MAPKRRNGERNGYRTASDGHLMAHPSAPTIALSSSRCVQTCQTGPQLWRGQVFDSCNFFVCHHESHSAYRAVHTPSSPHTNTEQSTHKYRAIHTNTEQSTQQYWTVHTPIPSSPHTNTEQSTRQHRAVHTPIPSSPHTNTKQSTHQYQVIHIPITISLRTNTEQFTF